MKKVKLFYELSTESDNDIDEIFKYTFKEFGINQAIKYVTEFDEIYKHLLINPTVGTHREEILNGLYSLTKGEHIIFYKILENSILIIRILHGSRDLPKYFK